MLISYVIRLSPELLEEDGFRGEVEAVSSGRREAFGSVVQLTDFIMKCLAEDAVRIENAQRRRNPTRSSTGDDGRHARRADDFGPEHHVL